MQQPAVSVAADWNQTKLTHRLGIEYPIIQGPLGGLWSQPLTAAVSNFGGLGSFGAHGLGPAQIRDIIAELRAHTSKPFAINLWVSMEDADAAASDGAAFRRAWRARCLSISPISRGVSRTKCVQ